MQRRDLLRGLALHADEIALQRRMRVVISADIGGRRRSDGELDTTSPSATVSSSPMPTCLLDQCIRR